MKILAFLIIGIFAFARINPFEPVISPDKSIKIVKQEYFKKTKVYLPNDARILKKIIFVYQSLDGDVKNKEVLINKNIDFHSPIIITHNLQNFEMKEIKFDSLFSLYIKDKKIFIKTKDKLIRKMFLIKPFRLVLDFKRNADFLTIKRTIKKSVVKKVVVGNHNGYYRVVLYFDANYKYKIQEMDEGIKIEIY
ncbi:conserved hypothetical protein [Lebetimonas natsushimae]|uniref:AMIN domain-containing protein n=1 Tax=Lebetimonas natsushimae TaxID=1936991 RepID=A0A292YBT2_9BACT|nr:AMIN domain-containing protein [Lebetimonas natsushimae]GAX86989.1 conserved hypothetical protein [Lebetimonas natsushimae]